MTLFDHLSSSLCALAILVLILTSCGNDDENVQPEDSPPADVDGNEYTTVIIGDQEWMVENLRVTRLNDETPVTEVAENADWDVLQTPGLCWYENKEENNRLTYGALYNGFAVETGKLCPSGWHVPSAGEWEELYEFLGDSAASKLKEAGNVHWSSSNKDATNSTGFTALPGGIRESGTGFSDKGAYGYWWTSTEDPFDKSRLFAREMNQFSRNGSELVYVKSYGLSVRCLKD